MSGRINRALFTPIRDGLFRWSTPDPADDWMMVGHLFVRDTGIVFVDPPLVPGLIDAVTRLGKPEAVILTTQNHTRATRYITKKTGIRAYLPDQDPKVVDEKEAPKVKELGDFEIYKPGRVLGFQAYMHGYDYALLSDRKELLIGDNAVGDNKGNVALWPYWYNPAPTYPRPEEVSQGFKDRLRKEFKDLVKTTGATSLLASHGFDIIGTLEASANEL